MYVQGPGNSQGSSPLDPLNPSQPFHIPPPPMSPELKQDLANNIQLLMADLQLVKDGQKAPYLNIHLSNLDSDIEKYYSYNMMGYEFDKNHGMIDEILHPHPEFGMSSTQLFLQNGQTLIDNLTNWVNSTPSS